MLTPETLIKYVGILPSKHSSILSRSGDLEEHLYWFNSNVRVWVWFTFNDYPSVTFSFNDKKNSNIISYLFEDNELLVISKLIRGFLNDDKFYN